MAHTDQTATPPLPVSDLHRLQLCYQTATPVSSVVSSNEDLDYPWGPVSGPGGDCLPYYQQQSPPYSNQHLPIPPPPQHHHYQPRPVAHYPHHLPYLKSEYGYMPFNMAEVPHAHPGDYADDAMQGREGMVEMDQEEVDAIIRNKRKVRDPKACYACHRRKVKCDRNLPCDSCVKRDHPELCSYERPTKKRRIALSNALAQNDGATSDGADRIVNSGPNITVPKEQWERMKQEIEQLKSQANAGIKKSDSASSSPAEEAHHSAILSQSDDGEREGVMAQSNQTGSIHLGSRSVLAYMIGNRSKSTQDAARSLLEENILPNLGLDNEMTTYPFVDLWSTDSSMSDVTGLVKALPDDSHCREFWLTYRDIPCTIYPVVPDKAEFEAKLNFLLQNRAQAVATGQNIDTDRPYGVSMSWLALLFAVLASGSQSTGRQAKERELTSQVYICCSYQALRMSNFMTHPSLETIEALLIIGNALSYNMNPGVSYILLGMTLRSALTMGLHQTPNPNHFSEREAFLRGRIWWALAWQDSHFSVSYDRPSSSILCTPEIPFEKGSLPGRRSYVESMSQIIRLTQEIIRERILDSRANMSWSMITKYRDEVYRIWNDALPRLRDTQQCVSMTDHLERLALRIHCSYMISEICRPALKDDSLNATSQPSAQPLNGTSQGITSQVGNTSSSRRKSSVSSQSPGTAHTDPQIVQSLRAECIKYLEGVVDTYVELRSINKYAARSWIGIQRSISAAFILGVLPETRQETRVIRLLNELEKGIEQSNIEDGALERPDISGQDGALDMSLDHEKTRPASGISATEPSRESAPWVKVMTKSLNALSKLNQALSNGKSGQFTLSQSQLSLPATTSGVPGFHDPAPALYHVLPHQQSQQSITSSPTGMHMSMNHGIPPQPYVQQMYPPQPQRLMTTPHGLGMMPGDPTGPPSATSSDWNYGGLKEAAMPFMQHGIWG